MQIEMNDKHVYKVDGKRKPSVTTILNVINKPALIPWAVRTTVDFIGQHLDELRDSLTIAEANSIFQQARKAADAQKREAGDIGTQVHEAIRSFFRGIEYDITKLPVQGAKAYSAFLDWINEHDFKCDQTEIKLYHPEYDYCGTADAIGIMDGERVLIDWKTGSGIYPEASMQAAAYCKALYIEAWDEMPAIEYNKAYIIRFPQKKGGFDPDRDIKILDREQIEEAFEVFLCALKIYRWQGRQK
jgi:hypothetical protein